MKKLAILVLLAVLCFPIFSFAADAVYERRKPDEIVGWHLFVSDDDIDASYQSITELNTTYTQLSAEDTVEVVSSSASDVGQIVTVEGIDNTGYKTKENISLNGTTVAMSSTTFRYIDQLSLSTTAAGTITIRRATGDTFINSIPAGMIDAGIVQHFNGEKTSFITGWGAAISSTAGSIVYDLRYYLNDADCLVNTNTGYRLIDQMTLSNISQYSDNKNFPQPIKCPAGGWIVIKAIGSTNDMNGSVFIQGYDTAN